MSKLDGLLVALLQMPEGERKRVIDLSRPIHDPGQDHRLTAPSTAIGAPRIEEIIKARTKAPLLPGIRVNQDGDVLVSVLIHFDGSIGHLAQKGARVRVVLGDVATADVPLDALASVAGDDHVLFVEAVEAVLPVLDTSVDEIGAGGPWAAGNSGRGVVVAVIDMFGLDLHHPDFAGRIKGLWDQNVEVPISGRGQIPEAGYGTVFDARDLAEEVRAAIAYSVVPSPPEGKHGTHVAGIAVGSGAASSGRCRGVAPGAELLFVNLLRGSYPSSETRYLIEALAYADALAGAAPCAVNISLGWASGPRDGTSLMERAIDHVAAKRGRAVIVAAGNEGGSRRYKVATIPASGEVELTLIVPPRTSDGERIEVWYPHEDDVSVTLVDSLGLDAVGPVPNGGFDTGELGGSLVIISNVRGPSGGGRCIKMVIMPLRPTGAAPRLRSGGWTLRIARTAGHPTPARTSTLHATIFGISGMTWEKADDQCSVTSPATAKGAISVGNYLHRAGGSISSTSSAGPTRKGDPKPDLAAPGTGIQAPLATAYPSIRGEAYVRSSGTSMAAPHVTGLAARILAGEPSLTGAEVKARLIEHADRAGLPPGWDPAFGWGRARAPQDTNPAGLSARGPRDNLVEEKEHIHE